MKFSDQLRRAIEKSGVSRYRLAQETGIAQSMLSRFMAGKALTTDSLDPIAALLGFRLVVDERATTKRSVPRSSKRSARKSAED